MKFEICVGGSNIILEFGFEVISMQQLANGMIIAS